MLLAHLFYFSCKSGCFINKWGLCLAYGGIDLPKSLNVQPLIIRGLAHNDTYGFIHITDDVWSIENTYNKAVYLSIQFQIDPTLETPTIASQVLSWFTCSTIIPVNNTASPTCMCCFDSRMIWWNEKGFYKLLKPTICQQPVVSEM